MSPLFRRRAREAGRDAELREAIAAYLDLSRSELRHHDPAWFALAEEASWERLSAAAGLGSRTKVGRRRTVAVGS